MSQTTDVAAESLWGSVVAGWLLLMLLCGGTSLPEPGMSAIQSFTSLLILFAASWRLRNGFPSPLASWGAALGCAGLALVIVHLVPMPAPLWQGLPGRAFVSNAMAHFGAPDERFTFTLSPELTWAAAKALLPGLAGYLAALTLRPSDYHKIAPVFVACALLGIGVSVVQKLQGPTSWFYLYGNVGNTNATGTFGNRNFFGAQLYSTIPFIAALAMSARTVYRINGILVAGFAVVYIAILVVGLGTTGARSALVFAIVSVMATLIYVYRLNSGSENRYQISKLVLAAIVLFALLSQVGMVAFMRLANTDQASEYRETILSTSAETARNFFPVGSGFGTFELVYQVFEKPENMIDSYVNHAHNDWLEIVVEGGVPAAILLAIFCILFGAAIFKTSRAPFSNVSNAYCRAGIVSASLLLLHSLLDFPLRTPAMMVFFAMCCALATAGQAAPKLVRKPPQVSTKAPAKQAPSQMPWKPVRR